VSQFIDAPGGRNGASLETHLEAVIERIWRYPWKLQLSEFRDALGGYDRARLDKDLEAVNGWRATCYDSVHQLVNSQLGEFDDVTISLSLHGELADGG
jgi:hypothetical protein